MEPLYKISSGDTVTVSDNIIYVKDLTGTQGDISYIEDPDNAGSYVLETNTTGYGATTRLRPDVALFLFALVRTTKGDVDIEVLPYEPLSVETFNVRLLEDGWHVFELYAVPLKKVGDVYEIGTYLYDSTIKKVIRVDATAEVVVDIRSIAALKVATSDKGVVINAVREKMKINNKINLANFNGDTNLQKMKGLKEDYDKIRLLIKHVSGEYVQGNKYVFQRGIEYINSNCCR